VGELMTATDAANPPSATRRQLGIDVGGSAIKWSIVGDGQLERTGFLATPRTGGTAVIDAICELATTLDAAPSAIGLTFPGTIDALRRRTRFIPNVPGDWDGFPVAEVVEQRTGLPVALLNDARAMAYAEFVAGAAAGEQNALFIALGTGVGGAVALGGKILIGDVDSIGEMGHFPSEADGELCPCGGRGCLETLASASAIVGRLSRTLITAQSAVLNELCGGRVENLTARVASEAALRGDPWALDAFARAGRAIGMAAGATCMLLQIPTLVLGGGLAPSVPLMLPEVRRILDQRISISGPIDARVGTFGAEAGSVGAALYAASTFDPPPSTSTSHRRSNA
jgi:glucokinase